MPHGAWGRRHTGTVLYGAGLAVLAALCTLTSYPVLAQMKWAPTAPRYGSGRLWSPAPVRTTLAMAERPASRTSEVQAAVWGMVAEAQDSTARLEAARPPALPVWKGKVAGAEFGLEGPWLILAGVKIPAAVLGLLPVSVGAPSPEQWEDARLLADRRADIERAAVWAGYRDAHKAAIADIRARREFERALNEAQQRLPAFPTSDTTIP